MITKNQIQLIKSLQTNKGRKLHKLFVAEGIKCISDILASDLELVYLFETETVFERKKFKEIAHTIENITSSDLNKISSLTIPNNCLAVFGIPELKAIKDSGLVVVLDSIQDPGNLGTIIRLCDWFGVQQVVCSMDTVDVYNPKVVQATMGATVGVSVVYADLEKYLSKTKLPIFGTFMKGDDVYNSTLPENGIVLLGNEGNGISEKIEKLVTNRLTIPNFNKYLHAESLNVATAAAVVLSEFRRRNFDC